MQRLEIVDLDSGTDYRRIPRAVSNVFYSPLTPETRSEIQKLFDALASTDYPPAKSSTSEHHPSGSSIVHDRTLTIWGRPIHVPQSSENVAWFPFDELCDRPLSAADYLEITRRFRTIFVVDVPKMGLGQKDLARRFITFIDGTFELSYQEVYSDSFLA